ncbi:MAG: hypothetical protein F4X92_01050, partial [Gammaproteobacteria bacterium]|nr:hypothetical protein [Gammaproteobacteria bacterium]
MQVQSCLSGCHLASENPMLVRDDAPDHARPLYFHFPVEASHGILKAWRGTIRNTITVSLVINPIAWNIPMFDKYLTIEQLDPELWDALENEKNRQEH